jgi:hypothetical protein
MSFRTVVVLVALCAAACAAPADPYRLDGPRSGAGVELAPYALHEECFTLSANDRIDFYFVSTASVAFNIHYHDANAVIMPLARERTKEESGEFVADRKETYCMMWEAGAEPALIDYRIRPLPTRP